MPSFASFPAFIVRTLIRLAVAGGLALAALPSAARAQQYPTTTISPFGSSVPASALALTFDYCSFSQITAFNARHYWRGVLLTGGLISDSRSGCDYYAYRNRTVTASFGENIASSTITDDNSETGTWVETYTFGAWVTPKNGTNYARDNVNNQLYSFTLQNTTSASQTYHLSATCVNPITNCTIPSGTTHALTSGEIRTIPVQFNGGSPGTTTLSLAALDAPGGVILDQGSVSLQLLTPDIVVAPHDTTVTKYQHSHSQVQTFRVQYTGAGTKTFRFQVACPSWSCTTPADLNAASGAQNQVTVTFSTPAANVNDRIYLTAYEIANPGNRDSGSVYVGVVVPSIVVQRPFATAQPPGGTPQFVDFQLMNPGAPSTLFDLTPTCSAPVTCTTTTISPLSLGTGTVRVNYTTLAVGSGTGYVKLMAQQQGAAGNFHLDSVAVTPTRSVAIAPHTLTVTPAAGTPAQQQFTVTNVATNPATFTFTFAGCSAPGPTNCSASNVVASAGNPATATVNYTPGASGSSNILNVFVTQSGAPLNVDTATVTVNPSAAGPTVAVSSGSRSSFANAVDTATFTVSSSSTKVFNFTASCNGAASTCSAPNQQSIGPTPVTLTLIYTLGGPGTSVSAVLTATENGVPANTNAGTVSVASVGPRVTVTGGSLVVPTAGSGKQAIFTVRNDTTGLRTYALTVTCPTAVATGCTAPSTVQVGAGATVPVTVTFTAANGSGGTITLQARDISKTGNVSSGVFTVAVGSYNVAVTPKNVNVSVNSGPSQTQTFYVRNSGAIASQMDLSCFTSGHTTGCTIPSAAVTLFPGDSVPIVATFAAGAPGSTGGLVRLRAIVNARTEKDSGWVNVSAVQSYIVASTAINNYDNHRPDLCEASCFAGRMALSTVPYVSLDQPRSITLAYNSDAVAVRPIVHTDVSLAVGAPALQEYWLEAKDSTGALLTFVNGDTKLRFTAPAAPTTTTVRLSGQFNAGAYSSGVYPISLIITAKYTGATPAESRTINTKFLVVNERASPIAKGWTVAGLSKLKVQGLDAVIIEGSGAATYFVGCGSFCYTSPAGNFSRLSSSGSGGGQLFKREYPDSSRAEYNNVGQLLRLISRTRDTTAFVYDGSGRLTQVADPFRASGTTHLYTALNYNATGITSIQEPGLGTSQAGGRITTIAVSSSDSTLQQWTEPNSDATKLRYDASKRLDRVINVRNDTSRFVYNAVTWKLDSTLSPTFDADPRLHGAGAKRRLSSALKPWQTISVPRTTTASATFTPARADTLRATVTETGGQVTAFRADRWGQPLVVTQLPGHTLQRVTTISRGVSGLPDSVRSHTGAVDKIAYNTSGLPIRVQRAGESETNIDYTTGFAQPAGIWGPGRPTQVFYVGLRGRVDSTLVAGTYKTRYAHDTRHRVTSMTDPGGHATTFSYDPIFGNASGSVAPGSRTTTVYFDGYGRDTSSRAVNLPRRSTVYDPLNRVTKAILDTAAGTAVPDTTTYVYTTGTLAEVTDPKGATYRFAYNALGAMTTETDPAGAADQYFFDAQGNASTWINRRGDNVWTTYDALHRPLEKQSRVGSSVRRDSLTYDAAGLWIAGHNAVSRDTIYLDATGWTTGVATYLAPNWQYRFHRQYLKDALGRLDSTHVTLPGMGATGRKLVWDATTGALTAARVNGAGPVTAFNSELLPASVTYPGGIGATLGTISIHSPYSQNYNTATQDAAFWRSLNYDAAGRIDIRYATAGGQIAQRNYSYDARGRLVAATDTTIAAGTIACDGLIDTNNGALCDPGAVRNPAGRDSLKYDRAGNITYLNGAYGTGSPTYVAGKANVLSQWPKPSGGSPMTYTHDAAGNRTQWNRSIAGSADVFYAWSADGLLDTVRVGTGGTARRITYDYNVFGQLVRKSINGVPNRAFLWDQDNLLAELDGNGRRSEYAHYPGLDAPYAMLTGDTAVTATQFIQRDQQGNVIGLTTAAGGIAGYANPSDAWGDISGWPSGAGVLDTLRLRWKGAFYEADSTQLYYMRARWYDAATHRFLSQDPIGLEGGINPYTFAENDPVNLSDPSGLDPMECPVGYAWALYQDADGVTFYCAQRLKSVTVRAFDQGIASAGLGPFEFLPIAGLAGGTLAAGERLAARLVIGKLPTLKRGVAAGERTLLPLMQRSLGTPKANWARNAGLLRDQMRRGQPIRDASTNPITGALMDNTGFLRMERNLLQNHGWTYNPGTRFWSPP